MTDSRMGYSPLEALVAINPDRRQSYSPLAVLWSPDNTSPSKATDPVIVGFETAIDNVTGGSVTINIPAGTAVGDKMFLIAGGAWETNNTPAGWTIYERIVATYHNGTVYTKTATSGDIAAGTVTVTFAGATARCVIFSARGGSGQWAPEYMRQFGSGTLGTKTISNYGTSDGDKIIWIAMSRDAMPAISNGVTLLSSSSNAINLHMTREEPGLSTGRTNTITSSGGNGAFYVGIRLGGGGKQYFNPDPVYAPIAVEAQGSTNDEAIWPGLDFNDLDPGITTNVSIGIRFSQYGYGYSKNMRFRLRDGGVAGTILADSGSIAGGGDDTSGDAYDWTWSGNVTPATSRLCVTYESTAPGGGTGLYALRRAFSVGQAPLAQVMVPVGVASEVDSALPVGVELVGVTAVPVDPAVEVDAALPITLGLAVGTATEIDVALPIGKIMQPDLFADPLIITGVQGSITHDMTYSTMEAGEPNPNGATKTSWFEWTAPDGADGQLERFHTRGATGDTTLAVFTGDTLGTLVEVESSDDASGDDADLRFLVTGGQTYHIQVGLKSGVDTAVSLTWLSGEPQSYDAFAYPLVLSGPYGSEEFTNLNNTVEAGETAPLGTLSTSWLKWTASNDAPMTFTVRSISPGTFTVKVFSGGSFGTLVQHDSATGSGEVSVTFDPTYGAVYRIQVSSPDDIDSGFEVSWVAAAAPTPPAPYPYPAPSAGDPLPRIALRAEVYERDGVTLITEVPRRLGVAGQESLNVVGSGGLSIPLNDPVLEAYPDLLAYGNIVKFFIGDVCIQGFEIKRRKTKLVSGGEYVGLTKEVYGPSVQYLTNYFIVRHDGEPRPDSLDSRYYSWASKPGEWYEEADWQDTVNQWSMDNPPSVKKEKKPKNWRVRTAKWINMVNSGGWRYFRKNWNNDVNGRLVRIMATSDEWWSLFLDGELIMSGDRRELGYLEYKKYDTVLSKGQHTFAALSRSFASHKGDGNDSFLFAMCEIDLDGKLLKPPLLVSDNSWKGHKNNPPPGWNRAQVMRSVIMEAQDRGNEYANRLTIDFDGEVDSNGDPWPDINFNQEVKIGTTCLALQGQLSEGNGFDTWVDPSDLSVKAWVRRGTDKSASVTLEPGRNLVEWEVDEVDEVVNDWLIQYKGGWTEYKAKGSVEDYDTRESYVSLGNVRDEDSAEKLMKRAAQGIARAQNRAGTGDARKRPQGQPDGGLIGVEGAYPFLDFNVGDVVKGPRADGKLVPMRVLSLSFTEDANGYLSFDPELEEIRSV